VGVERIRGGEGKRRGSLAKVSAYGPVAGLVSARDPAVAIQKMGLAIAKLPCRLFGGTGIIILLDTLQ